MYMRMSLCVCVVWGNDGTPICWYAFACVCLHGCVCVMFLNYIILSDHDNNVNDIANVFFLQLWMTVMNCHR